jgi:nitrate reductase NapD
MNVSGILVVVPPDRLDAALERLNALPGVDVHHTDPASGRIVVTQEAQSVGDEVEGLKQIKALPDVVLAEMVYHHFEDSTEIIPGIPEELAEAGGLPKVPPYLLKE